jgi:hypothetical protein
MLLKLMTLEAKKVVILLYRLLERYISYHFLYPYFFQFSLNRIVTVEIQRYCIITMIENGVYILGKKCLLRIHTPIFHMSEESDIDEIVEDDFEEDLDEDMSDDIDEG